MIELNLPKLRPVNAITRELQPLYYNPSLFVDERVDMPNKIMVCQDCGINNAVAPIASNGYCKICNELHNHLY